MVVQLVVQLSHRTAMLGSVGTTVCPSILHAHVVRSSGSIRLLAMIRALQDPNGPFLDLQRTCARHFLNASGEEMIKEQRDAAWHEVMDSKIARIHATPYPPPIVRPRKCAPGIRRLAGTFAGATPLVADHLGHRETAWLHMRSRSRSSLGLSTNSLRHMCS